MTKKEFLNGEKKKEIVPQSTSLKDSPKMSETLKNDFPKPCLKGEELTFKVSQMAKLVIEKCDLGNIRKIIKNIKLIQKINGFR